MSDDERIARCAELAQRVWPDLDVRIVDSDQSAGVYSRAQGEIMVAMVLRHPRALDALEAALRVLDVPEPARPYDAALMTQRNRFFDRATAADLRIAELEAQLAEQREHQRKCTVAWQAAEEKLFLVRVWNRKSCDGVAQAQLDAILDGKGGA